MQKASTSLLGICIYMRKKSNKWLLYKSPNNPIVDVLRPAQKLQVWNMYIPQYKVNFIPLSDITHETHRVLI